jgi:hypothetical protein
MGEDCDRDLLARFQQSEDRKRDGTFCSPISASTLEKATAKAGKKGHTRESQSSYRNANLETVSRKRE